VYATRKALLNGRDQLAHGMPSSRRKQHNFLRLVNASAGVA
jgi:hypothetical protein